MNATAPAGSLERRERPSNWYLPGFLIPSGTPREQRAADDEDDDFADVPKSAGLAEESTEDRKAAKKAYFPSSMGLSFVVAAEARKLAVTVRWGDYAPAEIAGRSVCLTTSGQPCARSSGTPTATAGRVERAEQRHDRSSEDPPVRPRSECRRRSAFAILLLLALTPDLPIRSGGRGRDLAGGGEGPRSERADRRSEPQRSLAAASRPNAPGASPSSSAQRSCSGC